jgi:Leu/Phe-tRNA-protein transferase
MPTEVLAPRVLRLTIELHVPRGLTRNIRVARVQSAADQFVTAVRALTSTVFPWADRLVVRREWSYQWWSPDTEVIQLPPNDFNDDNPE